jgi:hypothetical protein
MNRNLRKLLKNDATQVEIDRFNLYYAIKRLNENKEFCGWINKTRLEQWRVGKYVAKCRRYKTGAFRAYSLKGVSE